MLPLLREKLPEETLADLMMLVLVTPEEMKSSILNFEFEHPSPTML